MTGCSRARRRSARFVVLRCDSFRAIVRASRHDRRAFPAAPCIRRWPTHPLKVLPAYAFEIGPPITWAALAPTPLTGHFAMAFALGELGCFGGNLGREVQALLSER